jgi:hypothetical protein
MHMPKYRCQRNAADTLRQPEASNLNHQFEKRGINRKRTSRLMSQINHNRYLSL